MAAFGGNESCPSCGARMATDQRYCLNCGHRRGEPRLPFMDAVVFMESMKAPGAGPGAPPPPPPAASGPSRMNANAALIAGVATLVLAIGVGFLIGRTGHAENGSAGGGEVKVVQVGGAPAGGESAAATTSAGEAGGEGSKAAKGKGGKKSTGKKSASEKSAVKEGSKEEEELAEQETQKVLHSKEPLLEPKAQVGDACEEGVAGCTNGKFEGNFFE